MGNACAEVQQAAAHVTTSNDDEGFAKAMEWFILGPSRSRSTVLLEPS